MRKWLKATGSLPVRSGLSHPEWEAALTANGARLSVGAHWQANGASQPAGGAARKGPNLPLLAFEALPAYARVQIQPAQAKSHSKCHEDVHVHRARLNTTTIVRRARGQSGPGRPRPLRPSRLTRPPMSESLIVDLILRYIFRMVGSVTGVAEKRTSEAI